MQRSGGHRRSPREAGQGGFTLIELLVVVIIIGILAGIAIPVYLRQRELAYDAMAKSDVRNASKLEFSVMAGQGSFTTDFAVLESEGWAPSEPGVMAHAVCVLTPGAATQEFVVAAHHARGRSVWLVRSADSFVIEDSTTTDVRTAISNVEPACDGSNTTQR